MKLIINRIRKNKLPAFFGNAFAITRGLGSSYLGILQHEKHQLISLVSIAT